MTAPRVLLVSDIVEDCGSTVKFLSADPTEILKKISTLTTDAMVKLALPSPCEWTEVWLKKFSDSRFDPEFIYLTEEKFENGTVHHNALIRCALHVTDEDIVVMKNNQKDAALKNKQNILLVYGPTANENFIFYSATIV